MIRIIATLLLTSSCSERTVDITVGQSTVRVSTDDKFNFKDGCVNVEVAPSDLRILLLPIPMPFVNNQPLLLEKP